MATLYLLIFQCANFGAFHLYAGVFGFLFVHFFHFPVSLYNSKFISSRYFMYNLQSSHFLFTIAIFRLRVGKALKFLDF